MYGPAPQKLQFQTMMLSGDLIIEKRCTLTAQHGLAMLNNGHVIIQGACSRVMGGLRGRRDKCEGSRFHPKDLAG